MGVAIEELILEAQKQGKFHNLPGSGKPQRLDPSPDAVVNGLLKEAKYTPEWADLSREADALLAEAERLLVSHAETHARELANLMTCTEDAPVAADPRPRWWRLAYSLQPSAATRSKPVAAFNRQWEITLARYSLLLQQAEAKIRRYNGIVPFARQQRKVPAVRELREEFAARFPRLRETESGVEPIRGALPALMPLQRWRRAATAADHNHYRLAMLRRTHGRCAERRYDETYRGTLS